MKMMQKLKPRTSYLLMEALLFLGFGYIFLFSSTNANLINFDVLKASTVLVTVVGLAWLIAGKRTSVPLVWPLTAWVLLYGASVALSVDPRRSLSQMILMAVAIFILVLSTDLVGRGWPAELVIKCILLAGALVVLIGWLVAINWYRRWLAAAPGQWLPSITYRPGSANVIAMFMNLLIILALARIFYTREILPRILSGCLILASGGLLFLTSSRGGWLGLAVGVICLMLLNSRFRKFNLKPVWQSLRQKPVFLILISISGAVFLLAAGYLMYRQMIHPTHSWSFAVRRDLWLPAWQAFLKSPWFGSGPFTYSNAFMAWNSIPPLDLYIHPHSMLFSILAERGITGILCAGWLAVALGLVLWRRFREVKDTNLAVVIGASAALAALVFHGLFDCFHTEPIAFWGVVAVLGAALGGSKVMQIQPKSWWKNRPWWILVFVLALWAGLWQASPLYRGVEQANSGQLPLAAASFEEAVQRDRGSVIAYQQLGLANSILAAQGDSRALVKAVSAFEETVRREPNWAVSHANLGMLYFTQGNLDRAQQELQDSVKRAPSCAVCYLNLGVVSEALGNLQNASQAYQKVLEFQPGWAGAYFWRSTPTRADASTTWLKNQPVSGPASLVKLEQNLAANPELAIYYVALAEEYLETGQPEKVAPLLLKADLAYDAVPTDHLELLWAQAELAANQGELLKAVSFGDQALQGYQMQGVNGPGSFGNLAYSSLVFRQPAMAVELVPQMQLISLPDFWGKRMQQLGKWYEALGLKDQARQVYDKLNQYIPDYH